MSTRIFIAIPVHNRLEIGELCVPTVFEHKRPDDVLKVYDDGSQDEERAQNMVKCSDEFKRTELPIGIEGQRRLHFREFWARKNEFTHLYFTDHDAPHDPDWRGHLLMLQELSGGLPVCGYNTMAHVRLASNLVEDQSAKPYLIRRFAPGVSYLLTMAHVEKVMKHIDILDHWDWTVPALLGYRMAIARTSHVEHIGWAGRHHPQHEGWNGGDRALNPTIWLSAMRQEIIGKLTK